MRVSQSTTLASFLTFITLAIGCTITPATGPAGGASSSSTSSSSGATDPLVVPGTDGGASGMGTSGCGLGEPNETRDQTTPVTLGVSYTGLCISGDEDRDWYSFTAPMDSAGGYLKIVLGNVRDISMDVTVYSSASHREIMNAYTTTRGETLNAFIALVPGEKYNVMVKSFGGDAGTYDMLLDYVKIADAHEPNDTREAAKPITAGTSVEAYLIGLEGPAENNKNADDWYRIELPAGLVSVRIENVPTDVSIDYELVNSLGGAVDSAYRVTRGETLNETNIAIPSAGAYFVRVGSFSSSLDHAGRGPLPDHFTRKYNLRVSVL